MKVVIEKLDFKNKHIQYCLDIRNKVFVEGQGVPFTEEVDGKDPECDHFLLLTDNKPTGTARIRYAENTAKIERVAILDTYRGMNLGRKLMEAILEDIGKNPSLKKAVLGSQTHAIPFYTKLGFEICSDEYMDAGIPHKDMQLIFNNLTISMQDKIMPIFTPINQENWSRKKTFDYYYHQAKCTYSITADIAIGNLRSLCKERGIKLYPALLYILSRAVNQIEEMRINYNEEGILGIWNYVSPCHTVFHQDNKTFSNIWTSYNPDFSFFIKPVWKISGNTEIQRILWPSPMNQEIPFQYPPFPG